MSTYKIMKNGFQVARVNVIDEARALAHTMNYAMMYLQDGDVEVYSKAGRKWVLVIAMEYRANP